MKQQRFADEYIISGNATQSAIKAGYSKATANRIAAENLSKPVIKDYIENKLSAMNNKKHLTIDEALMITSSIARGESRTIPKINEETGEEENVEVYPTFADSQKALEHFYKINGAFIDKKEISADVKMDNPLLGLTTKELKQLIDYEEDKE